MADAHCALWSDSVRFNRLGGAYQNGKPLPKWLRREIIALARSGVRQCDISHRLKITHGCVSKILLNYQRTGHFEPRRERAAGLRPLTTPRALRTDECIQEQRRPVWCETRHDPPLCEENVCWTETLQSPRAMKRSLLQREPRTSQEQGDGRRSLVIASAINLSFNEQFTTTSNENQPRQAAQHM